MKKSEKRERERESEKEGDSVCAIKWREREEQTKRIGLPQRDRLHTQWARCLQIMTPLYNSNNNNNGCEQKIKTLESILKMAAQSKDRKEKIKKIYLKDIKMGKK